MLGQHHRRAVQRLVDDRGDRRPARGGHVQDVGLGRRHRGRARDPVERLVELRGLDEVERRRRPGLRDALGEHGLQRGRGTRSSRGRERNARRTSAGCLRQASHASRTSAGSPSQPIRWRASVAGSSASAVRPPQRAAARDVLGPDLDPPDLAGVRRQRVERLALAGRDDRQHLPVELLEAADDQVAPRADAAHHIRIGALGAEQDPRPRGRPARAARGARGSGARSSSSSAIGAAPVHRRLGPVAAARR